jgi:hypothetical protein
MTDARFVSRRPFIPPELTWRSFTLIEAQRAGLTRWQLQGPSWRRLARGVYVWVGVLEPTIHALATVRLPTGGAFSGRTAAWLHGLDLSPVDPIEIIVPDSSGMSSRMGLSVRRAAVAAEDVVLRRGFAVTSLPRTLSDLSRSVSLPEVVVVADAALHEGLISLAQLQEWVQINAGRKGVASVRRLLVLVEPGSESPMETRLRLLLVGAGLPRPEAQVPLYDAEGRFLGRPDFVYRKQRLALEYDGGTHRDSLIADDRRQNRLQNAGFHILRYTAADLLRTPDSIVRQVREALKRRLSA